MASCSKQQEINYSDMDIEDPSERVKKITRMELYTIIKEFKGKKFEEKISLLEERLAQLTSCPPAETSVLTRSLKYFKTYTYLSSHIVPIGQLSEEATEARNKDFRKYRVDFARKFSRVDCNTDILNRLLLTSDPFISCNRIKRKKKSKSFSQEAISMLLTKTLNCDSSDDEDGEDEITCELGDSDSD